MFFFFSIFVFDYWVERLRLPVNLTEHQIHGTWE